MFSQIVFEQVLFSTFVLLAGMIGLTRLSRPSVSNRASRQPRLAAIPVSPSAAQSSPATPPKLRSWAATWPTFRPTSSQSFRS